MKRAFVILSDEAIAIWFAYQAKVGGSRDDALDKLLKEFGKGQNPEPEPEPIPCPGPDPIPTPTPTPEPTPTPTPTPTPEPTPNPTTYNVEISIVGSNIVARAGTSQIAAVPVNSDAVSLFKKAIDTVPNGGSLGIGKGTYKLSAPYSFGLNPDGSNIFYGSLMILNKGMHIYGAGVDETVLEMMPGQRSSSRHAAMFIIRGTGPMNPGYSGMSIQDMTIDGGGQNSSATYDGEGLILIGSARSNGKFLRLRLKRSWGAGIYEGYNGSGSGVNELVQNVVATDCAGPGIMMDTCRNSQVVDCEAYRCREGLFLNGNDPDWKTRPKDNAVVRNFKTDSQVNVWFINDFDIQNLNMDCSSMPNAYGFSVKSSKGTISNSTLGNSQSRHDSRGGATYIWGEAVLIIKKSTLSGYFGVHGIGRSYTIVQNCTISANGACYCTTDPDPVSSIIVAEGCTWSGVKLLMKAGATFKES
jgi:hypothetical protein